MQPNIPTRPRLFAPHIIALVGVLLLAIGLRASNLEALGDGNLYYTAGVASMLQSWSNFFFVAAEPGGSVSIDKPPLGLWIQALSAYFLGVNGVAVILPQIIAGVIAVLLLYHLIARQFGAWPGVVAALVLAITPVAVATDRNNTMDSLLVLTLLLAAWAIIKATEEARLRWLLIGAVLVGLGFNIKMLQALLPLPAFVALYFLGSNLGWWRKIGHLALAGLVLAVVSLAWPIAVDLTPASMRPYVGSSTNNTVTELIIGHNGLKRLFGRSTGAEPTGQVPPAAADGTNGGMRPPPPTDGDVGIRQPPGGGGPLNEIGAPGLLRLVSDPLSNEVSWLLPVGLVGMGVLAFGARLRLPLAPQHQALVLWGGWLIIELIFFSSASFFHAYYLIMLAAPLAALVGITIAHISVQPGQRSGMLLLLISAATLVLQDQIASNSMRERWWMVWVYALLALAAGLWMSRKPMLTRVGIVTALVCILITPLIWSVYTSSDPNPDVRLPHAYDGGSGSLVRNREENIDDLVAFLEANTQDIRYLVAVPSANEGDRYVLATGRPVLYIGGFTGDDPVVDADDLTQMVANGELRYILWGRQGTSKELEAWIHSHGTLVEEMGFNGGWGVQLYRLENP